MTGRGTIKELYLPFLHEKNLKEEKIMAMCEICGKKRLIGNRVSRAHNRTKHIYKPNIQKIRIRDDKGAVQRAYVCTKCIKSGRITKA